jgi:AraC-like DNA-binding protein
MARAERLLLEQDLPLPKVAEAVGYASTAAFSVAFKRVRGIPPSAVRKHRPPPMTREPHTRRRAAVVRR